MIISRDMIWYSEIYNYVIIIYFILYTIMRWQLNNIYNSAMIQILINFLLALWDVKKSPMLKPGWEFKLMFCYTTLLVTYYESSQNAKMYS